MKTILSILVLLCAFPDLPAQTHKIYKSEAEAMLPQFRARWKRGHPALQLSDPQLDSLAAADYQAWKWQTANNNSFAANDSLSLVNGQRFLTADQLDGLRSDIDRRRANIEGELYHRLESDFDGIGLDSAQLVRLAGQAYRQHGIAEVWNGLEPFERFTRLKQLLASTGTEEQILHFELVGREKAKAIQQARRRNR